MYRRPSGHCMTSVCSRNKPTRTSNQQCLQHKVCFEASWQAAAAPWNCPCWNLIHVTHVSCLLSSSDDRPLPSAARLGQLPPFISPAIIPRQDTDPAKLPVSSQNRILIDKRGREPVLQIVLKLALPAGGATVQAGGNWENARLKPRRRSWAFSSALARAFNEQAAFKQN